MVELVVPGLQKFRLQLTNPLLLASGSPRRKELLAKIGVFPTLIKNPNVDERIRKNESAKCYTLRMAKLKISTFRDCLQYSDYIMLSADTVVVLSGQVLGKPSDINEAKNFLCKMSGRRHRIYSSLCFVTPSRNIILRTVVSIVKIKCLSSKEIDFYLSTGEWQGKAGGYALQGFADAFVQWFRGSYSAAVGLPLCQVYKVIDNYLLR
ncbi:dTTP/UTP pyrophosphatase [Candidatus Xenohaliotis californiensis]|uniref:dTTP/UTP pyrophosphatase n=1 Tax=Candidatus Xenohaliotis californiensis TaxID=84677 RepID=A0ABP0EVW8_9RICK|nr:dTTP/UTP pyrophosphatase [Candidatus Xenohaliotis californiensis]